MSRQSEVPEDAADDGQDRAARRDPIVLPGIESAVAVPQAGAGTVITVEGRTSEVSGEHRWAYRVDVEVGLPVDTDAFAAQVHATLADPRGWVCKGHVFQRTDDDAYDFRVVLASPDLTDALCAPMTTDGQVSCRNGNDVVLNALRWFTGVQAYGADLASYRQYLVNHEVGHRLGHRHARSPDPGALAPVMMQQTLGVGACLPNPWPLATE